MYIDAEASLEYWDGESITSGWERLDLVVKFKEEGKLFRTKISDTLVSTFGIYNGHMASKSYDSYDLYYKEVETYLNDSYLIKIKVEQMVKEYFKQKNDDDTKNSKKKHIQKQVQNMESIKVRVNLD